MEFKSRGEILPIGCQLPCRKLTAMAEELRTFRIDLRVAVDLDGVRKYREEQHDSMPEDPARWQTSDLWRAICFGFVPKGASRVVAIEEIPPPSKDVKSHEG
jgi:hypothetical protein